MVGPGLSPGERTVVPGLRRSRYGRRAAPVGSSLRRGSAAEVPGAHDPRGDGLVGCRRQTRSPERQEGGPDPRPRGRWWGARSGRRRSRQGRSRPPAGWRRERYCPRHGWACWLTIRATLPVRSSRATTRPAEAARFARRLLCRYPMGCACNVDPSGVHAASGGVVPQVGQISGYDFRTAADVWS